MTMKADIRVILHLGSVPFLKLSCRNIYVLILSFFKLCICDLHISLYVGLLHKKLSQMFYEKLYAVIIFFPPVDQC
jgi:hypothetical protein